MSKGTGDLPQRDNKPPKLNPNIIKVPEIGDINPKHKSWDSIDRPTDVVLLTVKEQEFLNCYPYLKNVYKSSTKILGRVYFGEIVTDTGEKVNVTLLRCSEASGGVGGAQIVSMNAIATLEPKALICVGFCGGLNREKTKLGDVVISRKLATYARKGNPTVNASKNMIELVKDAAAGWNAPLLENPERIVKVKVHCEKVMLSGPELVDNVERQKELVELNDNAIAIEMEGEGVYNAAYDRGIEWVIVKGISDFADGEKDDTAEWRSFASAMAASVVHHMLKQPEVLKDWPHYKNAADKDTLSMKT